MTNTNATQERVSPSSFKRIGTVYRELHAEQQEIRLVRLAPSRNHGDKLARHLEIVPLDSIPHFQSLSYAWGQGKADLPLKIGDGELLITVNLDNALRAVRKIHEAILIWVDAICINQQDLRERNHQVQLMRQIFTNASVVNIWLGLAVPGVQDALVVLEQLARGVPLGTTLMRSRAKTTSIIEKLTAIFKYPWWQRLWVIQEALLARHAIVFCGPYQIAFETIMRSFESLWNEYVQTGQQLRLLCGADLIETLVRQLEITVRRLHIVRNFVFVDQPNGARQFRDDSKVWPFLLHTCSWSNVSDPRDKVYGTLGLFSSSLLEANYELSVPAAFTTSTFDILKTMGNLAILSQAISRISLANGLPSWVPDWREPSTTTAPFLVFNDLYGAGRIRPLEAHLIHVSTLRLRAALVDEVDEVSTEYDHQDCTQASDLPRILRPILELWLNFSSVVRSKDQSFTVCFTAPVSGDFEHLRQYVLPFPDISTLQSVQQSSKAPLYRDADYRFERPHYQVAQSQNAPLYKGADYTIVKGTGASPKRKATEIPQMAMQSLKAPLYKDADYSSPTTRIIPQKMGLGRPSAYRSYNSFTHTYVDQNVAAMPTNARQKPTPILWAKDSGKKYVTGEPSSEVFWRTLCMDVVECEMAKRHRRSTGQDSHRLWEWLDWILQLSGTNGIPQLHWHLTTSLQDKRMIKTKLGYIGLASKDVQRGDKMCVFAGESYPYVLRGDDNTTGGASFNLVSPAYVHGWMDGSFPLIEAKGLDYGLVDIT